MLMLLRRRRKRGGRGVEIGARHCKAPAYTGNPERFIHEGAGAVRPVTAAFHAEAAERRLTRTNIAAGASQIATAAFSSSESASSSRRVVAPIVYNTNQTKYIKQKRKKNHGRRRRRHRQ